MQTLLVANRGEIAVRILRSARQLGWATVAVYSEADRRAQHVALADQAICIGPAAAAESYLDMAALLAAADRSGATAVHPGYGFLAENATFAERCRDAGLIFVGPEADAIRVMGSKDRARSAMEQAGVPVVPGAQGEAVVRDPHGAAEGVGYPLLLKAAAGGGGKGMRVVHAPAELDDALAAVRREAQAAFGDSTLLMERWFEGARHVEVQVFADQQGNTVHLFDRDCSTQRRHQKVIEEAPAPGLSDDLRQRMAQAAVAAARAVDYVGAGTVEFLVAGEAFFFLEMNTRLQVEHPVTEAITGEDLVAWQLAVATGAPLPRQQNTLEYCGHAVEARLYAEDPARGYLPATGVLQRLQLPEGLAGVRVDAGVVEGDSVSPHYDPLVAKIVAFGSDREAAWGRLQEALATTRVLGVRTNLMLLRRLAMAPELRRGAVHTTWLEGATAELLAPSKAAPADAEVAIAAVARVLLLQRWRANETSLFGALAGFRLNAVEGVRVMLGWDDRTWTLQVRPGAGGYTVQGPDFPAQWLWAELSGSDLQVEQDGQQQCFELHLQPSGEAPLLTLLGASQERSWQLPDVLAPALARDEAVAGSLLAPMPGQVIAVAVTMGETVAEGQVLLVLEAMKMEHSIRAPHAGVVTQLDFGVGDRVDEGVVLAAVEAET